MANSRRLKRRSLSLPAQPAILLEQIRREIQRRDDAAEARQLAINAERIRQRCRSFSGFVREAWPVLEPNIEYAHGWVIDAICDHLEAVTDGEINRLLINVPPGMMKSLLVSVFWPAWEWGPRGRASLRYLSSSYSDALVKRDSRKMRALVTSAWYQKLWPHVELVRGGETSFENTETGGREGVAFRSMTGGRGDRVLIDDPHSTESAESEAERDTAIRIFRESLPTRLNDPKASAIVIIMQRLHADDISGQIAKLGLPYTHLMLPMEFEPARRCVTSIGFRDPRTYEGELLFPERFPREVVERDKLPMGPFAVAGQFQQRPAPRAGGLFKRSMFEIVEAVPATSVRCRAWDLAASKKKGADWTAGCRMARAAGIYYVEDMRREQLSPTEVETLLKATASQDPFGTMIRLPQDPGQAGKAQAEALIRLLAGYDVKAKPVTGDKETRAKPAAAQAGAGNIKLLRGAWNEAFLDEICSFPTGSNDDQLDAFADAFNSIALGSGYTLDNV